MFPSSHLVSLSPSLVVVSKVECNQQLVISTGHSGNMFKRPLKRHARRQPHWSDHQMSGGSRRLEHAGITQHDLQLACSWGDGCAEIVLGEIGPGYKWSRCEARSSCVQGACAADSRKQPCQGNASGASTKQQITQATYRCGPARRCRRRRQ